MSISSFNRRQWLRGSLACGLGWPAIVDAAPAASRADAALAAQAASSFYPPNFRLKPLAADPIPEVPQPRSRAAGLATPSYIDPVYGTRVYRVTEAADYPGATHVRQEYSRRQAFNADNTRFLANTSNGYWLLYDALSFTPLRRAGPSGALRNMAGDAEPIWHPTDPNKLWFTSGFGGLVWWEKDVESEFDTVMADFRGRLPWPAARAVWTKGEGCSSADGRWFAFMATSYNEASKQVSIHGLFSYDRVENRIVGTLDAAAFGGAMPDHISISPSGRYVVPSWAYQPSLGTRSYTRDFSSFRLLHSESEHSDLAYGPQGEDFYVATNYKDGVVWVKDLATGKGFDLMRLYPRRGAAIGAAHFSGKAFGRPGWVVMSTYADSAEHGRVTPDPVLQPAQRKIMLVELKPGGRQLSVAHTRAAARYGGYFGEHQATVSRDGSRILFATNFNDGGPPSSYLVLLPPSVYEG
ncbi:MAG: hypothetical protein JNJ71_20890 [Rubrivivax sp.]|nr:hypothetical protein [Rubrivivax sp.]